MKAVSEELKRSLKQPTTQRKGKILVNDVFYEVYNVEYYSDVYDDGNVIGTAIASQLDFDLPYMPKFNTFKYFDGVLVNGEYEFVDMGTFNVFDEKDEDEFNKHITAFDNLIKFNMPFIDKDDYPKTLYQELQNVCEQAGVELVNTSIVNGDFEVENNQFVNNENLKSVLKAICQVSGTYATIKEDKLVLQLQNETDEIINKSQHEPIVWKRKTYGINQLILGIADVEGEYVFREDLEDIGANGIHKLVINDNPFAYTQDKRDLLIDELFNQIKGFGYVPYELKGEWLNYIEVGDKVIIDDVETIVLRISGRSPKSLESEMSSPAVIDSAIEYVNNTNDVKNQLKRVEIKVDKDGERIDAVVDKQDEDHATLSEIVIENGTISSRVTDAETSLNDLGETISTIEGTFLEQTNKNFTMWFEKTGIQGTLDDLKNLVDNQNTTLDELRAYIRYGVITDTESEFYGSPYIELGKEDAQTKLRILKDRIQFLTGETQTAYISNNALYINESTILSKQVMGKEGVGKWITEIDEEGNLNTYWGGID